MSAADLLQALRQDGFTLKCQGHSLLVTPAGQLCPEFRAAIKTHRGELLRLLRDAPVSVPAGARLFFSDADGRPCKAEDAFMWCWEGAPRWFYTCDYLPPASALTLRPSAAPRCPDCARQALRIVWQVFSNGTKHLRCECAHCKRFLKHLKPPPGNVDLEYHYEATP
jgi:hypothetical protein